MELFYAHPDTISEDKIILDPFEAKHVTKTLRKKIGDKVDITDGLGNLFYGVIEEIKPRLSISINAHQHIEKEPQILSLGIAFIRPNRLEFILEKGTELGVDAFYLFRSEHANYFSDNKERFEKILRQAIKQSNRFYLPHIFLFKSFEKFIQATENIPIKIAAIDPQSPKMTELKIDEREGVLFCVGPEGGFSAKEIALMKENSFKDVSLGNYRLRAETAAIAGVAKLAL
jgi:16S rRNA (uracil1498-N3)-methyltransferase